MFRHRGFKGLGNSGAGGQQFMGEAQYLTQHKAHPGCMNSRVGAQTLLVVLPFLQGAAYRFTDLGVVRIKDAQQHRHAQEWPGDLNQREPFGVITGDGHSC